MNQRINKSMLVCYSLLGVLWFVALHSIAFAADCERLISHAPSITQILKRLDFEYRIVGVTDFDSELSKQIPRIGNLFHLNRETIITIKPTLALLLDEQKKDVTVLSELGVEALICDHRSLNGIHECIDIIGEACGVEEQAKALNAQILKERELVLRALPKTRLKEKVMIVIGSGQVGAGTKQIFISGKDGFYYQLLQLLDLTPIYTEGTRAVSTLQPESLIAMNPDHILHILASSAELPSEDELINIWKDFRSVSAVNKRQITSRNDAYLSIPGVNYPKVLRLFSEIFTSYPPPPE